MQQILIFHETLTEKYCVHLPLYSFISQELDEGSYQQSINLCMVHWVYCLRDYHMKLFCLPSVWRLLQPDAPLTAQHCWVIGLWPFSSRTHGATCEASPSLAENYATRDQEEQACDCALSCTVPFPLTGVTGSLLLTTSLKYLPIVQLNHVTSSGWFCLASSTSPLGSSTEWFP